MEWIVLKEAHGEGEPTKGKVEVLKRFRCTRHEAVGRLRSLANRHKGWDSACLAGDDRILIISNGTEARHKYTISLYEKL